MTAMSKFVKIVDRGWEHIMQSAADINGKTVEAGVFDDGSRPKPEKGSGTPASNVDIAIWQEYGVNIPVTVKMRWYLHFAGLHLKPTTAMIRIPARPFMQQTADKQGKKWMRMSDDLVAKVFFQQISVPAALAQLGTVMQGDIQDTISRGKFRRLHPFTIRRKKSSRPLVDTGQLRQSVSFKVVKY